jgi:hypothetical protein
VIDEVFIRHPFAFCEFAQCEIVQCEFDQRVYHETHEFLASLCPVSSGFPIPPVCFGVAHPQKYF